MMNFLRGSGRGLMCQSHLFSIGKPTDRSFHQTIIQSRNWSFSSITSSKQEDANKHTDDKDIVLEFQVLHQSKKSRARVGKITTASGKEIITPTFVPVGTNACVKALHSDQIVECGTQLMFCNTYHLLVHPTPTVIEKAGGLHKYMNCSSAIITDSGGFQVFSLAYGSVHRELTTKGRKLSATTATIEGEKLRQIDEKRKQYEAKSRLFLEIQKEFVEGLSGIQEREGLQPLIDKIKHDSASLLSHLQSTQVKIAQLQKDSQQEEGTLQPAGETDLESQGQVIKGRRNLKRQNGSTNHGRLTVSSSVQKISEEGVVFSNYRNGDKLFLTAESSIQTQKKLGADIIIPFDELPPFHIDEDKLRESVARTHRWQLRSLEEHRKNPRRQSIYGIVHGGLDWNLRIESTAFVLSNGFDGVAIGGSLGKTRDDVYRVTDFITEQLPQAEPTLSQCPTSGEWRMVKKTHPVHLLGIGDFESINRCVQLGVDSFDSSYPTRSARHGQLFLESGEVIRIGRGVFVDRFEPIDPHCMCFTCRNHTLAYLHHLFKSNESTFGVLATIHNLKSYFSLMDSFRKKILRDEL